jgi:hypothetical protein
MTQPTTAVWLTFPDVIKKYFTRTNSIRPAPPPHGARLPAAFGPQAVLHHGCKMAKALALDYQRVGWV